MLRSFYETLNQVANLSLLVAFNANIDSIKHLSKSEIQRIIDNVDKEKVKRLMEFNIKTIRTKEDFVAAFLSAFKEGKPKEIPLGNDKLNEWFDSFIGTGYERIGGQAGIVANLMGVLCLKKIIFYTNPLPKQITDLMEKRNIFYPTITNGKLELKKVEEAADEKIKPKINRIFEYTKGTSINLDEEKIIAKNSSRFIVASRPDEVRICFDRKLSDHLEDLGKHVDGAFVSGFHSIKEKYSDGLTFEYYISKNSEDLRKLKRKNRSLKIHMEMASLPNEEIRKYMIDEIFPVVDYVGMDNVELNDVIYSVFRTRTDENDIRNVIKNLIDLIDVFSLEGIQLHTYNYMLLISKKYEEAELTNALNFGSILAATKAALGGIVSVSDFMVGMKVPFNINGLKIENELNKIRQNYEYSIGFLPTRMVENPKITVGLGDTLSSGIFVALLSSNNK
ncbi:MAG: ADP-specific phosphofructokinase [Candidatus Aenigmarchaeota archaeon]|nr:ADP-specific phosphofructokinase [Candidatus Aenigmarchaeota archaeon]